MDPVALLTEKIDQLTATVARLEARIPPPLVTPNEAARHLGVSLPTIRRWVRLEKIAFVRRGRSVRIDLSRVRPMCRAEILALEKKAA